MITAAQLRAARALIGIDQRRLAELASLSVPTIQRMEASKDVIRGNVDSLTKLIGEAVVSPHGGRGVRLKTSARAAGQKSTTTRSPRRSRKVGA